MADCTAPPAPPSRLPTLEARKVEVLVIFGRVSISIRLQFQVVRRGGRTVGVSVLLAPHPGELARSCLPGAKEDGLITSTIRFPLFCAFLDQKFLAVGFLVLSLVLDRVTKGFV